MRNLAFLVAAALTAATPAAAQTTPAAEAPAATPAVAAGQTVYDPAGGEVGTIGKVENGLAVIATGTHDVALPLTSFAVAEKGPVIALTRDQLNAEAAKAKAATAAPAAGTPQP